MLIMTPSTSFYLCVKDGESAKQSASIRMMEPGVFSVRDCKGERVVSIGDLCAVVVYVHDSDVNHVCYVTWFEETNEIGFDCDKQSVKIFRYSRMLEWSFNPPWVYRGEGA